MGAKLYPKIIYSPETKKKYVSRLRISLEFISINESSFGYKYVLHSFLSISIIEGTLTS
jgi:hypothetical protein